MKGFIWVLLLASGCRMMEQREPQLEIKLTVEEKTTVSFKLTLKKENKRGQND